MLNPVRLGGLTGRVRRGRGAAPVAGRRCC